MRLVLVMAIALALADCTPQQARHSVVESSSLATGIKLGMVTDVGGLGDKSFNDSANRGLQLAKQRDGANITVLQSRSVTDYEPNLSALATQGDALVFAIGFLMHDSLDGVAPRFPKTHFAIVDSVVDQPNVTSITFKEEESSFLAGALAGLVSRKAAVGFIGGIQSPLIEKFQAGFTAGVKATNPHARVLVKYTGSFEDVGAGKEYATLMFRDADVIYAAAGKCGLGVIDQVKSLPQGYYVIGVDSDQDGLAPGKVLTSALKRVDNAVAKVAHDAAAGRFPGRHVVLGLKEGGVGLTDFAYTKKALPAGALATLEAYRSAIISGKLVVPSSLKALDAFSPPHLRAGR
ncbi:MAG: BMP family ABC transporter substrate-binding protein [Candidatus Eremiobacteraeota bacterium]|nr:BMP family ABC transporter substrate-binding protein [Candidatus Eremiobacteraeota bacterium]